MWKSLKSYMMENVEDPPDDFLKKMMKEQEEKIDTEDDEESEEKKKILEKAKKHKRDILVKKYKAIIYGFNSAKYDVPILFKSKRLRFQHMIDSYGILSLTLEGGYIEFRDAMRMTGIASFAGLCKDFKLPKEFSKTQFPHIFASPDTLNYVGSVPEEKYWTEQKIPEEFKDEKEFDFKEVSIHYQKLDVVSLCIIMDKLRTELLQTTQLDIFDFQTAPSLAYSYILSKAPPRSITVCSERSVDAFIRQSQQGGRCFPQKGHFFSEDCQAILDAWNNHDNAKLKFLYENCSDFLRVLDAVSLYPSAMWKFEYPSGKPYWEHDDEMVVNALNNRDPNLKLGIVECEITINPNQVCPLLSHKSPDGRLRYSTEPNQRVIKTTIDIMEAVRYNGARVTRVFNAFILDRKNKDFQ